MLATEIQKIIEQFPVSGSISSAMEHMEQTNELSLEKSSIDQMTAYEIKHQMIQTAQDEQRAKFTTRFHQER